MTDLEATARVRVSSGSPVERLVCHPRLPLVAGVDAERPAVHLWSCEAGRLRELGSIGAESEDYGDVTDWDRRELTPAVAWHPAEPRLVVAGGEGGAVQWTPAGLSPVNGVAPTAGYLSVAFAPDGRTLWASPSAGDEGPVWERSDVVDLVSGEVGSAHGWDTGVTAHPGGGLVVTLVSDQGATLGLFARVDPAAGTGAMRVLRRAMILDVDGYEAPLFSADGRHLAVRGNAYGNTLEVFAFPSLRRVLATSLGEPSPGHPHPQEWLDAMHSWSRHNLAFGARPGVLWVGTPAGVLLEVDVETPGVVEHGLLAGSPVTALAATAAGELVVADGGGEVVLVSVQSDPVRSGPVQSGAVPPGPVQLGTVRSRAVRPGPGEAAAAADDSAGPAAAAAASFLATTTEVPDDGGLEEHLVLTDGDRTWDADDLAAVDSSNPGDPTWLQLRAALNTAWSART